MSPNITQFVHFAYHVLWHFKTGTVPWHTGCVAHMGPSEKAVLSHCLTQRLQTNCLGASVPFNLRMERGPVTKTVRSFFS